MNDNKCTERQTRSTLTPDPRSTPHRRRLAQLCAVASLGLVACMAGSQDRPGRVVLRDAPLDEVVTITKPELVGLFRRTHQENLGYIRMLEGGEYNVNIRHAENVTEDNFFMLTHPDTIDVWIVQEGSGTLLIGGERVDDRHVGGEEQFVSVGDLVFIPAGIPHGMKETRSMTWLNIRFPEHRN